MSEDWGMMIEAGEVRQEGVYANFVRIFRQI